MFKRLVVPFVLILIGLLAAIPAGAQSTSLPTFEPGPCPVDLPAPGGVECGMLTVPEVHATPDGPTIQIAVAILKSTSSRQLRRADRTSRRWSKSSGCSSKWARVPMTFVKGVFMS